jgi:sucrose phosphorylase
MKNEVQLITYADRMSGGGLRDLQALLTGPLAGVFGAVHLLPFFFSIDGADAGFDPIDHTRVDPRLGDWGDIKALSRHVDVMADVIVNHMSSDSPQFADYSQRGAASPYDGLFLTLDAVFPNGATEKDLVALYRPRPGLPFTCKTLANGEKRVLWTTFTQTQIDIDVRHPQGVAYLQSILGALASNGVKMIRLDAVGYAIKTQGGSCFMMPATFDFVDEFAALARSMGLEVLVEVHSHYRQQIEIARRVDWVYDFALPPLVLHAFFFHSAKYLKDWIARRPVNALTVLDTHDGIGIIDIGADPSERVNKPGLVPDADLDRLVEMIHANSRGESREATGAAASNLDLYQVNCSFYDALGRDDRAYLLARAIQFFMPGIPQVYYVGLLAGGNDIDLLHRTGVGRDINRHRYTRDEVESEIERPVVRRLIELIRLRNSHPAFNGVFTTASSDDHRLEMRWNHGAHAAQLSVDFDDLTNELRITEGAGERQIVF